MQTLLNILRFPIKFPEKMLINLDTIVLTLVHPPNY